VLAASDPYVFEALVYPLGFPFFYLPYVSNLKIETSAGVTQALALTFQTSANGSAPTTNFVFQDSFPSQTALDTSYAAGTYTLSYTGKDDGPTSILLSLVADDFPPAPPFISNLEAAQAIDVSSNFTLSFGTWAAADTNDYVQLTVQDSNSNLVFATPALYSLYPQGALSATNSQIVISNGTLMAGETYTATLTWFEVTTDNLADFSGYPLVFAGFYDQTTFTLQTQSPSENNPPPPAAPTNLTDTVLTLTITNGSGPFASSGSYQLFTTATGSNYFVLGSAGGGFSSGAYVYTETGTNTGLITFTDPHAGVVTLRVVFNSVGGGAFTLSSSGGSQTGNFTAMSAYTAVNAPNIFLPGVSNGQFVACVSGDAGVNYTVESSSNLSDWIALTNLTIPNLTASLVDAPSSSARFYRAKVNALAFAPGTISGQSFSCTITAGTSPFAANGIFQWDAATNGSAYEMIGATGATNGSGTYSYTGSGPNTASIAYTDSTSGETSTEQLVFTSVATGYFYTTNAGSSGFQSGSFTLAVGPVLFFGNVRFTPDTARGASTNFPADGTSVSLSVTDAAGYVWSLSVPADALLTPATLSMTPFAGIDSSQSALPIISGVQLGPEGIQFCDGVTLTLTTPSALGPHATLLMGAGDGTGLYLVQTTNQANAYSTTLFHFSSGAASDASDQQWQDYLDENLPQAQAAYNQAQSTVQALARIVVQPPEPPDYVFNCSGSNPAGDEQVDAYGKALFAKESTAAQNLTSAARALILLTGDNSYDSAAKASIRQLIETAGFRKINSLLNDWSGSPLKFTAVAKAAINISRQDQLLGGPGLPNLLSQLASWLGGNVVDYYFNELTGNHDYSQLNTLMLIQQQIDLLSNSSSGDPAFFQRLENAYTFQVTLTVSDIGDALAIKAHGTVTVMGYDWVAFAQEGFPIGAVTNNFTYDSGTYENCNVKLPLEFEEGASFVLDCTNTMVDIFIYDDMASLNENWSCPDSGGPNDVLDLDFDQAFYNTHGTQNIIVDYNSSFYFTVPWQNMQAQPANATFTGPGEYVANDTVTFTIVVEHTPQPAPNN
jgi:hypothetical protein